LGIAISGWVFFWEERDGSGISGMRTVSCCGTEGDGIGRELTEADNGRDVTGALGGEKKFVDCEGEGEGTGSWMRTVSCGFKLVSDDFVAGGGGIWMRTVSFLGWSGSAISVGKIDQKSTTCHYLMLKT
jgi:hypothetical protein